MCKYLLALWKTPSNYWCPYCLVLFREWVACIISWCFSQVSLEIMNRMTLDNWGWEDKTDKSNISSFFFWLAEYFVGINILFCKIKNQNFGYLCFHHSIIFLDAKVWEVENILTIDEKLFSSASLLLFPDCCNYTQTKLRLTSCNRKLLLFQQMELWSCSLWDIYYWWESEFVIVFYCFWNQVYLRLPETNKTFSLWRNGASVGISLLISCSHCSSLSWYT